MFEDNGIALLLLTGQATLLILFSFFAFFNYLYGFASLARAKVPRKRVSNRTVAVVIAAFNERDVLEGTVYAVERLSYPNKLIVVADDSNDEAAIAQLRTLAAARGARPVSDHGFMHGVQEVDGTVRQEPIEIWEGPGFVLFHRPTNIGFKAGSLQRVQEYLEQRHIELMYVLDADWHPQPDTLEQTIETLEAGNDIAFVQTKRLTHPAGMNLFQTYIAILEEVCYQVDFEGRQVLNHPMLFSGCCALFRLDALHQVGGFTPGHLTEDLDLTNRLWLEGWKGVYRSDVVNYGEVPFAYEHYRRQQERWAAGSARVLREFFWRLVTTSRLNWMEKLCALRQNAYFATTVLTAIAIVQGIITVIWLSAMWGTYSAEYYLYRLQQAGTPLLLVIYGCALSNFLAPLIMIVIKRRAWRHLIHVPMTIWYAWSVLHTYVMANFKGLLGVRLTWFRTPKFIRERSVIIPQSPMIVRVLNMGMCAVLFGLYFHEGWQFGWFDEFAVLLLPAFLLGSMK